MIDDEIKQLVQKYDDLLAQLDLLRVAKLDAVPQDVKQLLSDIDSEFNPAIEVAEGNVAVLRSQIDDAVKDAQHTVETDFVQFVYSKGKTTWDGTQLAEYALDHPEIERFRKTGKPSVSVRNKN